MRGAELLIVLGGLFGALVILSGVSVLKKQGLERRVYIKDSLNLVATVVAIFVASGLQIVAMVALVGYFQFMNNTESLANATSEYPWVTQLGGLSITLVTIGLVFWVIWRTWIPYDDEEKAFRKQRRDENKVKTKAWLDKHGLSVISRLLK